MHIAAVHVTLFPPYFIHWLRRHRLYCCHRINFLCVKVLLRCVCVNAAKLHASTTEGNSNKYFVALIILSSLLTVSVFTIIGLAVGILRIKGKSSCMKGNGFNRCIALYHFLLITDHFWWFR